MAADRERTIRIRTLIDRLRLEVDGRELVEALNERAREASLSRREQDVLELVAGGFTNREIAGLLFISEETVRTHVRRILRKLGARSRAHAVGLISREETPLAR